MAAAGQSFRPTDLKKNQIAPVAFSAGALQSSGFVARTGYTGEDGFEIIAPAEIMESLWQKVLDFGLPHGLKPAGLGARDTLRTEVCYPLYGHELDEQTTPLEAGLGFFVALDKPGFVGRSVLADQKANGLIKRCVAFQMTDRSAPPRPHYPIWSSGAEASRIGEVSSCTQSPSLGIGIGPVTSSALPNRFKARNRDSRPTQPSRGRKQTDLSKGSLIPGICGHIIVRLL